MSTKLRFVFFHLFGRIPSHSAEQVPDIIKMAQIVVKAFVDALLTIASPRPSH